MSELECKDDCKCEDCMTSYGVYVEEDKYAEPVETYKWNIVLREGHDAFFVANLMTNLSREEALMFQEPLRRAVAISVFDALERVRDGSKTRPEDVIFTEDMENK